MMQRGGRGGTLVWGCVLTMLVAIVTMFLLASALFTALVSSITGSSGAGGGLACGPPSPTPIVGHHSGNALLAAAVQSPTTTGPGAQGCRAPTQTAAAVVAMAEQMANALYINPTCSGMASFPNCYDTWYTSSFPSSIIQYGQQVCPGCAAWANGTYQCVSFVRGAYSQVFPMCWTANAFDLWATYQDKVGWTEIPAGAVATAGQRGLPLPGDVIVFKDASVGHVAIVIAVVPPQPGQNGSVEFANANSVSPYTTMPLLPDLTVDASSWPGYSVWGYLRPVTR